MAGKSDPAAGYLSRQEALVPPIAQPPAPGLALVVVIPALAEPALGQTLEDLAACQPTPDPVEVLVVFNQPEGLEPALAALHRQVAGESADWMVAHSTPARRFYPLDIPPLAPRQAGVGLARKLGMDEAVRRLSRPGGKHRSGGGVIACLDGDCRVGPDYLVALQAHFRQQAGTPGCNLPFAHDFLAAPSPLHRQGIVHYELHLRCVVEGLRQAGHPHAFHTVGSAMAVTRDAYCRMGGMNRRQGAEDFYFLAKLFPLGGFSLLQGTTVVPSARVSWRVPFGTGRAMGDWLAAANPALTTYAPSSYRVLGDWLAAVQGALQGGHREVQAILAGQPREMSAWLRSVDFPGRWAEIWNNSASPEAARKRFFGWCNRFLVMKCLHALRAEHPPVPVPEAARQLLAGMRGEGVGAVGADRPGREEGRAAGDPERVGALDAEALLQRFRWLDGQAVAPPD